MAHHVFKGYSILFYFLMSIFSFFIGLYYAGMVEAGKNQGLAGGAIVLSYGVVAGLIGLVLAIFIVYKSKRKLIFWGNIVLGICIVGFWVNAHLKYKEKQKAKELEREQFEKRKPKPTTPTSPVDSNVKSKPMAMLVNGSEQDKKDAGLGMFAPNISESKALYFYGNPNFQKSRLEHAPIDSITFKKREYGGFEIATAPSWLMPDHLKLDYDMLYFKVKSVTQDFVEVRVNNLTNRTSFVDKYQGRIAYWPEFLLGVHSVEFINPQTQTVYVKPLEHAGKVSIPHSFMKPVRITRNWMHVELINHGFDTVGKGWIQWTKDGEFLIRYNLLS
ncbi:hypothetical protein H7U19_16225 [Hyunsoonleella sp. SJ7]|uniref:Uncharacterized protein n=1 Tax=Hyunsoonleella aquatilis TaxID=2762758 RepID=A0A923HIK3_9FLAO|nr:hypothetical protein [Hyunsoonleella aquatilis]MBC3759960.1 hypothetical protein [Hyunsoonleella aquatilis]